MESPAPTVTTLSSSESLSQVLSDSCERAFQKTRELKTDATRSHIVKRSLWRVFAEGEIRELREALKHAMLPIEAVQAGQDYLQALERTQSGTSLRARAWKQRLNQLRAKKFTL